MKRSTIVFVTLVATLALGIRGVQLSATEDVRGASGSSLESQIQALKVNGRYRADLMSAGSGNKGGFLGCGLASSGRLT